MAKSLSMVEPPKTDILHAKRLYSPLANVKRINPRQAEKRPYVIGICGGPSSGKSSVTKLIKDKIPHAAILQMIHFYKPIRGNLRRRSRADSVVEDEGKP